MRSITRRERWRLPAERAKAQAVLRDKSATEAAKERAREIIRAAWVAGRRRTNPEQ